MGNLFCSLQSLDLGVSIGVDDQLIDWIQSGDTNVEEDHNCQIHVVDWKDDIQEGVVDVADPSCIEDRMHHN